MNGKDCFMYKRFQINKLHIYFIAFILMLLVTFSFGTTVSYASSYGSWVRDSDEFKSSSYSDGSWYNSGEDPNGGTDSSTDTTDAVENYVPGTIEKTISGFMANAADLLNSFLAGGVIDLSISGIVMGKVINGKNFFVFDLTKGNIWGVAAASIYVALRSIAMYFIFISTLYQIVNAIFSNKKQGMEPYKQAISSGLISMFMLFIFPIIIDYVTVIRDGLQVVIYRFFYSSAISDSSMLSTNTFSLATAYREAYDTTPSFVNALVYLAITVLPIWWLFNYIKIALHNAILFGFTPVFVVNESLNKGQIKNVFIIMITNIFIPAIDFTLILLPSILIDSMDITGNDVVSIFIKALITIIILMAIVPVRNMVLQLLGNSFGVPLDNGLWNMIKGIGAAALGGGKAAYDMMKKRQENKGKSGTADKNEEKAQNEQLENAGKEKNMDEIGSSSGEQSGSDSNGATSSSKNNENGNLENIPDTKESASSGNNGNKAEPSADNGNSLNIGDMPEGESVKAGGGSVNNTSDKDEGEVTSSHISSGGGQAEIPDGNKTNDSDTSNDGQTNVASKADDIVSQNTVAFNSSEGKEDSPEIAEFKSDIKKASGKDKTFTDFNTRRAENLASIEKMQNAQNTLNASTQKAKENIAKNEAKLQDLQSQRDKIASGKTENGITLDRATQSKQLENIDQQINETKQDISTEQETITSNQANIEKLDAAITDRQNREVMFAQASANAGMSDKTYASAADFQKQLKVDGRKRDLAGMKNWRNPEINQVLTPSERMQYARKEQRRQVAVAAAYGAGKGMVAAAGAMIAAGGGEGNFALYNDSNIFKDNPNEVLEAEEFVVNTVANTTVNAAKLNDRMWRARMGMDQNGKPNIKSPNLTFNRSSSNKVNPTYYRGDRASNSSDKVSKAKTTPGGNSDDVAVRNLLNQNKSNDHDRVYNDNADRVNKKFKR